MTFRPYPNADRARRQAERHDFETPPLTAAPPSFAAPMRAAQPSGRQLGEAFTRAFTPGTYRLSSRNRGVVGGPS
ncbi:hypothetical protein [Streptomyces sp. NPDC059786]|uniref:hypothetical protein n=1 Tax=Streptomyces sp. NPDC059786 TaxID=3346946 RepID=UPI0036524EBC